MGPTNCWHQRGMMPLGEGRSGKAVTVVMMRGRREAECLWAQIQIHTSIRHFYTQSLNKHTPSLYPLCQAFQIIATSFPFITWILVCVCVCVCVCFNHAMWDLSFSTRDWTHAPLQWKHRILTTGPPGKSLRPSSCSQELCNLMEEPHPFKYSPNLHWAAFLWLLGYFSVFVAVPLPSPATVLHTGVPITSSKTLNGKTGKPPQLNIKSSLGPLTKFLCCCCC